MLGLVGLVKLIRSVDQLLNLETKHGKAIEKLQDENQKLNDRITWLETREEVIIEKARAAASAAATQVAIASVSDLSRSIGKLEERSRPRRLEPPDE